MKKLTLCLCLIKVYTCQYTLNIISIKQHKREGITTNISYTAHKELSLTKLIAFIRSTNSCYYIYNTQPTYTYIS